MMHPTLAHYLVVGAILFALGLFTAATRRNAIGVLLGIELILNAALLNFVAFDQFVAEAKASGQSFAVLIIAFAASEAAIALAVVLRIYRARGEVALDALTALRN